MPVILFLIDTSASMTQRTHLGTTYLDVAKGAVETFLKVNNMAQTSISSFLKGFAWLFSCLHAAQE